MRILLGAVLLLWSVTPLWAQPAAPDLPAADALTESEAYAEAVLAWLNQGGDLDALVDALVSRDLILSEEAAADGFDLPRGGVWAADFSGDGCNDVLVNVGQAQTATDEAALSVVWLFVCQDAEAQTPTYALGDQRSMETLVMSHRGWHVGAVADLTQDGADDFVMHWVTCGAHTCFDTITVMTWDPARNRLVEVLERSVPYGRYRAEDADADGLLDLLIEVGGIGSAGAGPQRPVTEVYRWTDGTLTLADVIRPPPDYRFQAAYDGIAALNADDMNAARAAFVQLRDDDTLLTFSFNEDDAAYRDAILDAVAVYGLLYVDAADGADLSAYPAQIDALPPTLPLIPGQDAPPDLNVWRRLSRYLLDQLTAGADLAAACAVLRREMVQYLPSEPEMRIPFGADGLDAFWPSFGYANAMPTPEELCPAGQDN